MRKISFLSLIFCLFIIPINIYPQMTPSQIRNLIEARNEDAAAKAMGDRVKKGQSVAAVVELYNKTFGRTYQEYLKTAAPEKPPITESDAYKEAAAAQKIFDASKIVANAKAFIAKYDALRNVVTARTHEGPIPPALTASYQEAQTVATAAPPPPPVTVNVGQVKTQNKAAADEALKVAKKIKALIPNPITPADANEIATAWRFSNWEEMKNKWAPDAP